MRRTEDRLVTELEWEKDGFTISMDPARIDRNFVISFLATSYWAGHLPKEQLHASFDQSVLFGVYDDVGRQIGFARVVTDFARFAWLSDIFIDEANRGQGLGHWLVETMLGCSAFKKVQLWMLGTADAQSFYTKFGFEEVGTVDGNTVMRLRPKTLS